MMKAKERIAPPLLSALLVLVTAIPCLAADDDTQKKAPEMSPDARLLPGPPGPELFGPQPAYPDPYDPDAQLAIYGAKHMNKTAFPPVDLGLGLYERGTYDPRPTLLGQKEPLMSAFMMFGDFRTAVANYDNGTAGPNGKTNQSVLATRLNLDMDWQLTATERFHAFVRPLDKNGSFTRYQLGSGIQNRFVHDFNFNLKTLFFEGDLAAMVAGLTNRTNPYDRPIAVGRIPIATQNGIWIDDAFDGFAAGLLTAKNSEKFDISNMDLTFFAGFNKVATPAVPPTDKANMFALAGFADALRGYIEWGYGFVEDTNNHDFSYHNLSAAFSKRYLGLFNNSVRVIGNFGQKGIAGQAKRADGVLLLVENSLIPRVTLGPVNLVPYANFWAGFRSPQALARAADAGGVLKNTGINFETDGLTGYPTLDATAHDTYGGAAGVEYLFKLDQQIIVEGAVVERRNGSLLPGNEEAIGVRYQRPISNAWILRLDAMQGFRQGQKDVHGARLELRLKF